MEYPSDCFSDDCYRRFPFLQGDEESPFWQGWANLRLKTFQLIENKYFETAVITMILLSSLALVSIKFQYSFGMNVKAPLSQRSPSFFINFFKLLRISSIVTRIPGEMCRKFLQKFSQISSKFFFCFFEIS